MRSWATLRAAAVLLAALARGALSNAAEPAAPAPPVEGAASAPAVNDDRNIHLLIGQTWEKDEETFAVEVSFERRLTDWLSLEAVYDNEGHVEGHHRDSVALQLFAQRRFWSERLRLRIGVGPQLYFDTQNSNNFTSDTDAHGVGVLGTVAAEVDLAHGIFAEARANGAVDQNDFSAGQVLLGLGYHLGPPEPVAPPAAGWNLRFTLLGGLSVRNSLAEEKGAALMVGVGRDAIVSVVGASLSYLRLGSDDNRQGAALLISAEEHFFDNWLIIGAGVGPYLYSDSAGGSTEAGVAGLMGPKLACEIVAGIDAVVLLMREFGHRDYDLALGGFSAEF